MLKANFLSDILLCIVDFYGVIINSTQSQTSVENSQRLQHQEIDKCWKSILVLKGRNSVNDEIES